MAILDFMPPSPEIASLRAALQPEPGFQGYPPPRRKHMAEHSFEQILRAIDHGLIPLGPWEQQCLSAALACLRQGQYDQARINAVEALRDVEERAPDIEALPARTLDSLRHDFQWARARPVMER